MSDLFQKYKQRLTIKALKRVSSFKKTDVTVLISKDVMESDADAPLADKLERENTILLDIKPLERDKSNSSNVFSADQATPRASTITIAAKDDSDADAAIAKALHLIQNYIPEKKSRKSYLTAVSKRWRSTLQKVVANSRAKDIDMQSKRLTEEYDWNLPSVNERVAHELRQEEEEAQSLIHMRPIYAAIPSSSTFQAQPPFFALEGGIKVRDFLRSRSCEWSNLISTNDEVDESCIFTTSFAKQMISYTPRLRSTRTVKLLVNLEECSSISLKEHTSQESRNATKSFKVGINLQDICSKIFKENKMLKHTIRHDLVPNQHNFPTLFGKSDVDIFENDSVLSDSSAKSNFTEDESNSNLDFDYYDPASPHGSCSRSLHPLESDNGETCDWNELQGFLRKKRDWLRYKKRSTGMIGIQQLHRVNKILEEEEGIQKSLTKALSDRITPKSPIIQATIPFSAPKRKHLRVRSCPQDPQGGSVDRHLRSNSEELKQIALSEEKGLKAVREYLFPIPESRFSLEIGTELDNLL